MRSWFKSNNNKSLASFTYYEEGEDLVIKLLQNKEPTSVADWIKLRPDAIKSISELQIAADGLASVTVEDDGFRLSPSYVAALDASSANTLGLPGATHLGLDLKAHGGIHQDIEFFIQTNWVRPGGQRIQSTVSGALIRADNKVRRIPEPLWSLYKAAIALSTPIPNKADRFRALSELRKVWPLDNDANFTSDPLLQDLRVHYASSFSLKLRELTPDRTDFDPVLFGSNTQTHTGEPYTADEDTDNVLTPASQKLFAEDRFRREPDARPVYVLRDGEYIFIDPALRPVLSAVRKIQDRPESIRRDLVLNPRRVLRGQLGDEVADRISLDDLFIETEQFSERVAGVDTWRKPVLPWLLPIQKNQWLPEKFGIRLGEEYYSISPENLTELSGRVKAAAAVGESTINAEGLISPYSGEDPSCETLDAQRPALKEVALTPQFIESIESLAAIADAAMSGIENGSDEAAELTRSWSGKLFLVVRDNLEEVEFSPVFADEDASILAAKLNDSISQPTCLKSTLKPHQEEGLAWLIHNYLARHSGALLADDMGLGKTLQALAFMAWMQEKMAEGSMLKAPILIVAPTGLLGTWKAEIDKHLHGQRLGRIVCAFGGDLKHLRAEGISEPEIESGKAALNSDSWQDAGVVLTTFETMRDYHFSFARTPFALIVYDEIQKLKNPASQMTRAAKALNGKFTLGMTGTPVENRLQDLWSIMDIVSPGLLGASRDFEARYPSENPKALSELKEMIAAPQGIKPPYMLRRLKSDHLKDMPIKHLHALPVTMPTTQATAYRDVVMRAGAAIAAGNLGRGGMLKYLQLMRGISLHPLDPIDAPSNLDEYAQDSARLLKALDILSAVSEKHEKALIFLEDLCMQERLATLIQKKFSLSHPPMRINGGVPGQKRQKIVERFQLGGNKFDVLILSPRAGGVGLTLTAANHVIHLSRWWNPAVEDQATDRVYRIGQTRDVHVYVPLAVHPDPDLDKSSFDLRLNALIERKRHLSNNFFLPLEANERDVSELFEEVSVGEPVDVEKTIPSITSTEPNQQLSVQETAEPIASRPTLTVTKQASEVSRVRLWRCEPGVPRPVDELISLFDMRHIVHVVIRDPYSLCTPRSRNAQIQFLKSLQNACKSIDRVTIEYAPEAGDQQDSRWRREFGSLFVATMGPHLPKLLLLRRNKRAKHDDFHDRFVEIDIRHSGGAIKRHEISIGRGLEALFDDTKQCTMTYAPPSAQDT